MIEPRRGGTCEGKHIIFAMTKKKQNPFETIFHDFVTAFGGEVLPEADHGHTADYFFRKRNIIAELYHDHPDSYRRLIADILRKRSPDGSLRYSHIHGGVYFSAGDVKSREEKMYF